MFLPLPNRSTKKRCIINLNNVEHVLEKVSDKENKEHDYIALEMVSGKIVNIDITYKEFTSMLVQPTIQQPGTVAPATPESVSQELGENPPATPIKKPVIGGSQEISQK